MTDTLESLRRKMGGAGDLKSVVRTMKALAASSIGQYERAARSLDGYYRTVELGLTACLRGGGEGAQASLGPREEATGGARAVVFGSDQGLVGQFNDVLAEFVVETLGKVPGEKVIWTVGDRIRARLEDAGFPVAGAFNLPNSVNAISPLTGKILLECEAGVERYWGGQVFLFHNRPSPGALYEPVSQRLLPLDDAWRRGLLELRWPTVNLPEAVNGVPRVLESLVGEYLFVSLFRACAESLVSENASRLAAMQRAEKNIEELLESLGLSFNRLRQSSIDEELFDVIAGYESLGKSAAGEAHPGHAAGSL